MPRSKNNPLNRGKQTQETRNVLDRLSTSERFIVAKLEGDKVLCRDEKGYYATTMSYVDSLVMDPNRHPDYSRKKRSVSDGFLLNELVSEGILKLDNEAWVALVSGTAKVDFGEIRLKLLSDSESDWKVAYAALGATYEYALADA